MTAAAAAPAAAATAAAAAVAAKEEGKQASTCSKVLYNNARCGQPVVSPSVDYCTVSIWIVGRREKKKKNNKLDPLSSSFLVFCSKIKKTFF